MWVVKTATMVKKFDAHFSRINELTPLMVGDLNCIITSSMDRTIKVWNLNNIFEEVHHIDRMESQIDSVSLSVRAGIVVTATRGCIGVWEILTGKLKHRLSDSSYGAIVSHAVVRKDGDIIVAAECGFVLYWKLADTQKVVFKEKQSDILQILMFDKEKKSLVVSRPNKMELDLLCIARTIPEGEKLYEFEFSFKQFKNIVLSTVSKEFVCYGSEKSKETLFFHCSKTGELLQKLLLKYPNFKEPSLIVAMPDKHADIAIIDPDKGVILDSHTKKVVRVIPKWGGKFVNIFGLLAIDDTKIV